MIFSGAASSKNKTQLEDLAFALGVPLQGTKADAISRIDEHFDNHQELKTDLGPIQGHTKAPDIPNGRDSANTNSTNIVRPTPCPQGVRAESEEFKNLPWITTSLTKYPDIRDLIEEAGGELMEPFILVLHRQEMGRHAVDDHFAVFSALMRKKPLAGSSKSTQRASTFITLMQYRIIDVALLLVGKASLRPPASPEEILTAATLPTIRTPLQQLDNLKAFIMEAYSYFQAEESLAVSNVPVAANPTSQVSQRLFTSICRRKRSRHVGNMFSNLETAAFHLRFLLEGHADLPKNKQELVEHFVHRAEFDPQESEEWKVAKFTDMYELKGPLYLALAISPLLLLLGRNLQSRPPGKEILLDYWKMHGYRPASVIDADREVWGVVWDIAAGGNINARLKSAFGKLSTISFDDAAGWSFGGQPGAPSTAPPPPPPGPEAPAVPRPVANASPTGPCGLDSGALLPAAAAINLPSPFIQSTVSRLPATPPATPPLPHSPGPQATESLATSSAALGASGAPMQPPGLDCPGVSGTANFIQQNIGMGSRRPTVQDEPEEDVPVRDTLPSNSKFVLELAAPGGHSDLSTSISDAPLNPSLPGLAAGPLPSPNTETMSESDLSELPDSEEEPHSGASGSGPRIGTSRRGSPANPSDKRGEKRGREGKQSEKDRQGRGKDKRGTRDKEGRGKDKQGRGKDKQGRGKEKQGRGKDKQGGRKDKQGGKPNGSGKGRLDRGQRFSGSEQGEAGAVHEGHSDSHSSTSEDDIVLLDKKPVIVVKEAPAIIDLTYDSAEEETKDRRALSELEIGGGGQFKHDLAFIEGLHKAVLRSKDVGAPSRVHRISWNEYKLMEPETVVKLFRTQSILVTDIPLGEEISFRDALRTLGPLRKSVVIQDQSIPLPDVTPPAINLTDSELYHYIPEEDSKPSVQHHRGTFRQILESVEAKNPKSLNALDIASRKNLFPEHALFSDTVAWSQNEGKHGDHFPTSDVRWSLASSGWTLHQWHEDSNGFATFIKVVSGEKWWFIGTPRLDQPPSRQPGGIRRLLDDFDLEGSNEHLLDVEAVVLTPSDML
ncbi:hypothetical protein DXG01_016215 [Tephrocybe rancida]|nr:hypothetical protein DXG01_016215 [Tephrocybe rancida]